MTAKPVSISRLPLAPSTRLLTHNLTADPVTPSPGNFHKLLQSRPSLQRRARLLESSAHYSHVTPLPIPFPFRIELPEGTQDKAGAIERWLIEKETLEPITAGENANNDDLRNDEISLTKYTSSKRIQERELIGVSPNCVEDCIPLLDIGNSLEVIGTPALATESGDSGLGIQLNSASQELLDVLSGHTILASFPPNQTETEEKRGGYAPWSLRYSGHQFGTFAGQLGDGRAISILETLDPSKSDTSYELQLKGAGRTPFSRSADGLAVVRSSIREYLCAEAMAALRIPTSRSLALTYLPTVDVRRERLEKAAIVTRVAPSFLRIGSFEALNPPKSMFFFGGGQQEADLDALRVLGEYVSKEVLRIELKDDEAWGVKLLTECARRNALMVAGWQAYGFMHGVINTDNVSILGLTIDYGPYAFMDVFDHNHICNHSDEEGRYSYKLQPTMILYALQALLNSLAPLIGAEMELGHAVPPNWDEDISKEQINKWSEAALSALKEPLQGTLTQEFSREYLRLMRQRLGLTQEDKDDLKVFVEPLLDLLHKHELDFHSSFRRLAYFTPNILNDQEKLGTYLQQLTPEEKACKKPAARQAAQTDWKAWLEKYSTRISAEGIESDERAKRMLAVNPRFVLRQWVLEEVIQKVEQDHVSGRRVLAKILEMGTRPFDKWGNEDGAETNINPETLEEARLCGLGDENMLGFQCSCSS